MPHFDAKGEADQIYRELGVPTTFLLTAFSGEFLNRTVGIAGEYLSGADIAPTLTRALGQKVRYNAVPPEVYGSFGFPRANDLGNMFQFKRDLNEKDRWIGSL